MFFCEKSNGHFSASPNGRTDHSFSTAAVASCRLNPPALISCTPLVLLICCGPCVSTSMGHELVGKCYTRVVVVAASTRRSKMRHMEGRGLSYWYLVHSGLVSYVYICKRARSFVPDAWYAAGSTFAVLLMLLCTRYLVFYVSCLLLYGWCRTLFCEELVPQSTSYSKLCYVWVFTLLSTARRCFYSSTSSTSSAVSVH